MKLADFSAIVFAKNRGLSAINEFGGRE